MSTFINQTIARQQVDELIAQAEAGRVRRQFRVARRTERSVRRRRRFTGPSNSIVRWPHLGIA
jgi:hypothetical protein